MPYEFVWHDDDHTIVRLDSNGSPSWEQFHEASEQVIVALRESSDRIDVIINDQAGQMPPGNPLPNIKRFAQRLVQYPNMGKIVLVSNQNMNSFMQSLVKMVYRIYGIDTRIVGAFVTTLEEAEQAIASYREQQAVS